jgi:hypothetical protein
MFNELFKRNNRKVPPEERFFSSIHGYSDTKKLLMRAIFSKESISTFFVALLPALRLYFLWKL